MAKRGGTQLKEVRGWPVSARPLLLSMLSTGGTDFFGTANTFGGWNTVSVGNDVGASDGRLVAYPIVIDRRITVDALRINVTTAADSGDHVRLGIYNSDRDTGEPTDLVVDTGDVVIDTTGVKDGTFTAITLQPSLYWFAMLPDLVGATNPVFRGQDTARIAWYYFEANISSNAWGDVAWQVDGQGGTLADPFPSGGNWVGGNGVSGLYIQARVA